MVNDAQLSIFDLLERPDGLLKPEQIYASDDYRLLCRLTEDDRFDRKSARIEARDIAPCLSAFGNGPAVNGGVVAIGISNSGLVEGCKNLSDSKLQSLENLGFDRCPTARFRTKRISAVNVKGEEDFIIVARIYYVEDRLIELTDGTAYLRKGDKCKELDDIQKQELRIEKGERAYELERCALTYPADFKYDAIDRFVDG